LQRAGAEERLSQSQFGFRRGRSTTDAIFLVRRRMGLALAQRFGRTAFLALDWKRAFGSINTDAMLVGLRRFGVPEPFLQIIASIFGNRRFRVADGVQTSAEYKQGSGISQGCPLSPFLFVMIMSLVVTDAVAQLPDEDKTKFSTGDLSALLYADDTLLISSCEQSLQRLLNAVAVAGSTFGMELGWGQFQLLQIRCQLAIRKADGEAIPFKNSVIYLGSTLYDDGGLKNELHKRLGKSWADFNQLSRLLGSHDTTGAQEDHDLPGCRGGRIALRPQLSLTQCRREAAAGWVPSKVPQTNPWHQAVVYFTNLKQTGASQSWPGSVHHSFCSSSFCCMVRLPERQTETC